MEDGADHRADRRREDAEALAEDERPGDDAAVVHDGREADGQEPALGDEHLAEDDRRGEDHRRHAHDAEQADVQLALALAEPRGDDRHGFRREDEQRCGYRSHDDDGERQDRPTERAGLRG